MRLIPAPSDGSLVFALNPEELMILLQPGEMFRALIDGDADGRASVEFMLRDFANTPVNPEVRVALPSTAAAALLTSPAGHATERQLQHLIFDALPAADRPLW
jgi:hypothetical protein